MNNPTKHEQCECAARYGRPEHSDDCPAKPVTIEFLQKEVEHLRTEIDKYDSAIARRDLEIERLRKGQPGAFEQSSPRAYVDSLTSKEESSFAFRFAKMWHDLIGSPVMNTRRYTEAQGMMEEADAEITRLRTEHENFVLKVTERLRGSPVEIERLHAALERYGRHAHPNCHDLKAVGSAERNGCLCGLDAVLSGNSSAPKRHSRDCDCHDCRYAKKHPQIPHHALCGCWSCTGPAVETTDRELIGKTIAENTRMRVLLRAVTESWVNGRRVLDGIDKTFADQVRLVFGEHSPEHKLVEPIKVGSGLFGVGVPLRLVLERIERGYDYAVRGLVPPAQETSAVRAGVSVKDPTPPQEIILCAAMGPSGFICERPKGHPGRHCDGDNRRWDAEKAPVTSAETCPAWDQVQHKEHNGKCVYCGAPMPPQKASSKPTGLECGDCGSHSIIEVEIEQSENGKGDSHG